MRIPALALALAIALPSAACIATDDEAGDPAPTAEISADLGGATTNSPTGVQCSNKSWRVNFYSEPEMVNVVGTLSCVCFQPQLQTGVTTLYAQLAFERVCDFN